MSRSQPSAARSTRKLAVPADSSGRGRSSTPPPLPAPPIDNPPNWIDAIIDKVTKVDSTLNARMPADFQRLRKPKPPKR